MLHLTPTLTVLVADHLQKKIWFINGVDNVNGPRALAMQNLSFRPKR